MDFLFYFFFCLPVILWTEVNIKNEEYRNQNKKEKTKDFFLQRKQRKYKIKAFILKVT